MKNSIKWGLVTFCGCITCATLAHYLPDILLIFVVLVAGCFSLIGALAISEEQLEN